MSQLSSYAENQLADFVRGQTLTLPASWHLALGSAASDSAFTELTGTGYSRIAVARSLANFAGTQAAGSTVASTGTSHTTSNNNAVDYGTAGSAWGNANFVGFFDAASSGNCWIYLPLDTPLVIGDTDPVSIDAGAIEMTLGLSGGMSNWLSNKLIDLLFRAEAFTWPATLYAALYTAAPSNAGGGTEVAGGSYARVPITSDMTNWSGTQSAGSTSASTGTAGRISNNAAVTYPAPTADWGAVTHEGLLDAATVGNLYFWRALQNAKSVPSGGTAPAHLANTMGLTLA